MRQSVHTPYIAAAILCFSVALQAQPPGGGGGRGMGGRFSGGAGEKIDPEKLPFELGVASVPNREMFEKLSYQGPMRMDEYLSGLEFVKFIIENAMTESPKVYWMNTQNIQAHPQFMGMVGMRGGPGGGGGGGRGRGPGGPVESSRNDSDTPKPADAKPSESNSSSNTNSNSNANSNSNSSSSAQTQSSQTASQPQGRMMRGAVTWLPRLKSPDGTAGLYVFDFQPNDRFSFEEIKFARDCIVKTMPFVAGKIAFHPLSGNLPLYRSEKAKYDKSDVAVHLDDDIYGSIAYLPLNAGESFGRLTILDNKSLPSTRDIVICKTLPNQLPRVAGVITEERQTPLSHVNLRAVQDKIPNAFIGKALETPEIKNLVGKFVSYKVAGQGYKIREATPEEVDSYFKAHQPNSSFALKRDLSKTKILPLKEIQFSDSASFGVKTANIATMLGFDFPAGTVPDGAAIPFYFYDEFMKHNGFYEQVASMLNEPEFKQNRDVQAKKLEELRSTIRKGKMPEWMMTAIEETQKSFAAGTSIRCRSSTNNEDLPGFSGAGLYDSCTHKPNEGHLANSVKQIYASLWNDRAFEEREFYHIDHMQVAMGVLLHPNFSGEKANGVAVTDDILYQSKGNYYINTQPGEDLVTNPDEQSSPEEVLLGWWKRDGHKVVRKSASGEVLLGQDQLDELRERLARIHNRFRVLYGKSESERFAMEIEFKITKDGKLSIKQARPWVF